jgi:hypothetical protein
MWQSAFHTDKHPFAWLADNPWGLKLSIAHMSIQREYRPVFLDDLDFEKSFAQNSDSSTILFVDIGGSNGSQSLPLRQRYPSLPGRVFIQEQPEVLGKAKEALGSSASIEVEVYDIVTPQVVQGMARPLQFKALVSPFTHVYKEPERTISETFFTHFPMQCV